MKQSLRDFWDNNKMSNIHVTEVLEEEKKEYVGKIVFEDIVTEKFPCLAKDTNLQNEEAYWTRSRKIQRNQNQTNHNQIPEM